MRHISVPLVLLFAFPGRSFNPSTFVPSPPAATKETATSSAGDLISLHWLDGGTEIALRGRVAGKLISDQHARDTCLPLQDLAKQALGGPRSTLAVDT